MDKDKKIHVLSQELIPFINELDPEPKQIIIDHAQYCEECRDLLSKVADFDKNFPEHEFSKDVEIKPLKKLAQVNIGLRLLLIATRAIILFYIFYSSFRYNDLDSTEMFLAAFQGTIFLFYFPAAVFLLVFTFTFFNKRWLWISLALDLIIILFLDNIVQLFL
ncbi:hypothetical protein [Bacillus sp. PS06]|uniref:hypothetical protein n=1 Tax=Bacillus sp. PS06 TaxID=2764176 RepID=UPI001786300D|nr:hypothetical protein [Bacillus sp. PS06]MBD8069600.1 hypothetical protein [Bacillus sp. PS06]